MEHIITIIITITCNIIIFICGYKVGESRAQIKFIDQKLKVLNELQSTDKDAIVVLETLNKLES